MNYNTYALVKNLSDNDFKYLSQEFSGNLLELIKQKGVYPYKYMDNFKKFSEDKLPDRCEFYSSLKINVLVKNIIYMLFMFEINTMCDSRNLYLKADFLSLADVFEKFINTCLDYYQLDPCHYFTSPGLSWDAMLKMTQTKLELISGTDIYLLKKMRVGISYIAKRFIKANNI